MNLTKQQLEKIKYFGVLQYDIDKVVTMIAPELPDQFRIELSDPDSVPGFVYHEGLNVGQFKLDAALFKLQSAQAELETMAVKRQREADAMISDYLGENLEIDPVL